MTGSSCLSESRTVTTMLNEQCHSRSLLANVLDLDDDVIRTRQQSSSYYRYAQV